MITIRKNIVLHGEKNPGGIDQVDHGQPVFHRDFLRPENFFAGQRKPGARLDGRIVRHDHTFATANRAQTDNHSCGCRTTPLFVQTPGRECPQLEQLGTCVDQRRDPLTGKQLALLFLL